MIRGRQYAYCPRKRPQMPSKREHLRSSVLIDCVILKAEFPQDPRCLAEPAGDFSRYMSVGTDRDQFSSHFAVAGKDLRQRVKIPHPFYERRGIYLERYAAGNKKIQYGIDPVRERYLDT